MSSKYEAGDFLKVEFKDDLTGESEWMWVKVDYCDEGNHIVFGWLDNEPVADSRLTRGAHLAIQFDNIREHKKPFEF